MRVSSSSSCSPVSMIMRQKYTHSTEHRRVPNYVPTTNKEGKMELCVCEIKTGKEGVKFENDAPACKCKKRSMARDDIEPT